MRITCIAAPEPLVKPTVPSVAPSVMEKRWNWKDYSIRYKTSGSRGPPVLMIHGFGGNCDHWSKNLPVVGEDYRAYSIDLFGFGMSDKPDPRIGNNRSLYTFENWSEQVRDFTEEVIQEPAFLVCNSIGGIVGLQAAVDQPELVKAVQLMNLSIRKLHVKNQPALARPFIKAFQDFLYGTPAGSLFFKQVAKPETVREILKQAYYDEATVTDELVDIILKPGLEPGADRVFLAFISYSDGPLPAELLEKIERPVSILWGQEDPWEKIEWGRELSVFPSVEEFVEIPKVGHCPMCEKSEVANRLIKQFLERHS